jgi:adenosylcobinamide-GDP ribazoletransferase
VTVPLPLLIALQFLTRLPIRLAGMPAPEELGRSLLWYPLVGLLLGATLLAMHWLLGNSAVPLQAACLLAMWVAASGGLHLDGLADTADAWVGGLGDRERTLTIMKDPRSGPIAVVVLVLVLLLKFVALWVLLAQDAEWAALLLAPVLGRSALLALFMTTPYVRAGGLGQALATHLPRPAARGVLLAVAVAALCLGLVGLSALLVSVALFFYVRRCLRERLGGFTGDTAGALLELVECAVMLALALQLG